MSLMYRIKRLVKSDAYAIVEGLEDPKLILAQAIRDMESELEKLTKGIHQKKDHLEKLKKQELRYNEMLVQIELDINLSIDEKREDIAKKLIRNLIIHKRNIQACRHQSEILMGDIHAAEKDLAVKKQSYDEVLAQSELLNFSKQISPVFEEANNLVAVESALEHEVELEFLRRLKSKKEGV